MPARSDYGAVSAMQKNMETESLVLSSPGNNLDQSMATRKSVAWLSGIGAFIGLLVYHSFGSTCHEDTFLVGSAQRVHVKDLPLFFDEQQVDHFDEENTATWSNRYYKSTAHFQGSGHPIFLMVGGEGALDHGMLYPFVTDVLAKRFGAAVLQVEHRFYGPYRPIPNATDEQLVKLLTPSQAMADMVQLTRHVRDSEFFDCDRNRDSDHYCPVITVGGSYPGFLSAMLRIVHGDFVDISYASSAPLLMYAQISDQISYYDIVTSASDRASPGCSKAVRHVVEAMIDRAESEETLQQAASRIGVCPDTIPPYITNKKALWEAIVEILSYAFADYDMSNYPPGAHTSLYKACRIFQNVKLSTRDTLFFFLQRVFLEEELCDMTRADCGVRDEACLDLTTQLPDGPSSTLEDTAGDYQDGRMWDFQTCTDVIFLAGFSNTSLFPPQRATMKHLAKRCQERFGVTPRPTRMVDTWDYMNKLNTTSHILFVNGMQDMWAGGSVLSNVSDTVVAINLENGAHHSDLSHQGPSDLDTKDVTTAFIEIQNLLEIWLNDLTMRREDVLTNSGGGDPVSRQENIRNQKAYNDRREPFLVKIRSRSKKCNRSFRFNPVVSSR